MTTYELIDDLRQHGVRLTIDGESLTVDAPKGILTGELQAALIEHKSIILIVLQGEALEAERQREGKELAELFELWESADDPTDPMWFWRWAAGMIAANAPFYPNGVTDQGADGWRGWAAEYSLNEH